MDAEFAVLQETLSIADAAVIEANNTVKSLRYIYLYYFVKCGKIYLHPFSAMNTKIKTTMDNMVNKFSEVLDVKYVLSLFVVLCAYSYCCILQRN